MKPSENVLWFTARHVVEEEKDIKRAMEFLHECDLLKIEDILPFFPDFVTIDHFKVSLTYTALCYEKGGANPFLRNVPFPDA